MSRGSCIILFICGPASSKQPFDHPNGGHVFTPELGSRIVKTPEFGSRREEPGYHTVGRNPLPIDRYKV